MNSPRSLTHCPHRQPFSAPDATVAEQAAASCSLVSHLHSIVPVPQEICHACCNFPVPKLPNLNPVVASHLYATAAATLPRSTQSTEQMLSALHLLDFCRSRLLSDAAPTAADTPGNAPPSPLSAGITAAARRRSGRVAHSFRRHAAVRIGLMGWNSRFGLGHVNRDLAKHLRVSRWLVPSLAGSETHRLLPRCQTASPQLSAHQLADWLGDVDLVLFVEQPSFPALLEAARQRHTPVVCIPHWEWLTPGLPWLCDVDLMLCPTRFTAEMLTQWKARYGFAWQIEYLPWPIEASRFAFRQRQTCERFLFVSGRGGARAQDRHQPQRSVYRKGLELVLHAADKLPQCEFLIYTTQAIGRVPSNVQVQGYVPTNTTLYAQGDVCLQPSYWEGIGLPLLECQAAGLPLVTINAPPMNEYEPWAVVPTQGRFVGAIENGHTISIPNIDTTDLVDVLGDLRGRSVAAASRRARHFVETQHAWSSARPRLLHLLTELVDCHAPKSS